MIVQILRLTWQTKLKPVKLTKPVFIYFHFLHFNLGVSKDQLSSKILDRYLIFDRKASIVVISARSLMLSASSSSISTFQSVTPSVTDIANSDDNLVKHRYLSSSDITTRWRDEQLLSVTLFKNVDMLTMVRSRCLLCWREFIYQTDHIAGVKVNINRIKLS